MAQSNQGSKIAYSSWSRPPDLIKGCEVLAHCYLCGSNAEPLDEEHVVARRVFKSAPPKHYAAKLSACPKCHIKKTFNDEYVITALQQGANSPSAIEGTQRFYEATEKGRHAGLKAQFEKTWQLVDVQSPKGLYLGQAPGLAVDRDQLREFCSTIAKGLWIAYTGKIFDWQQYELIPQIRYVPREPDLRTYIPLSEIYKMCNLGESWGDIFAYRARYIETSYSTWWFHFYQTWESVVLVRQRDC